MPEEITIDLDSIEEAHQLYKQGHLGQAEKIYRNSLLLDRSRGDIYFRLGYICLLTQRNDEAIELFEQSLALSPDDSAMLFELGSAFLKVNKFSRALECFSKVLSLDRHHAEAIGKLAYIHLQEGRIADSIQLYKQAIAINPNHSIHIYNLACAYSACSEHDGAIQAFKRVTELEPDNAEAFHHLATTLRGQGQLDEAISTYEQALSLLPDYAEAHFGLSLALLLSGHYARGWEEYEWRVHALSGLISVPPFPQWDGQLKFHNGDLLVLSEQGLGDTFQFIRYAPQLKSYFNRVLVYTPQKLVNILGQSIDVDSISECPTIASKQAARWIPLLSIPRFLGAEHNKPIVSNPYLHVSTERVKFWRDLFPDNTFIVGLNWQGNPEQEKRVSRGRSFSLSEFEVLSRIPGLKFISLQKGAGSEQMETCRFKHVFVDCQAEVDRAWDFIETAAIVKNCNLVITSDTSLAHLAGALGQQTWILLKQLPDWRWGLSGSQTAWYPSARLFRQQVAGDWQTVMIEVKQVLEKLVPAEREEDNIKRR
ncbi:MAG: tetratricopeptide repeat-containing glycosyltransferase family protein [Cyanobacteria bacterium J06597_1]